MMYFGESVKAVERISVLVHADDPVARGGVQADLLGGLLDQVGRARRCGAAPAGLITSGLSERETDVIRLVAEGLDTREIASKLCYSERTIKNVLHGQKTLAHSYWRSPHRCVVSRSTRTPRHLRPPCTA